MRHRFRAGPCRPAAGQPTNAGPWGGPAPVGRAELGGEPARRLHPDHARRGQARVGLAAVIAVQVPHREALVLLVLACADAALLPEIAG
jgi:hypothetical protein